MRAAGLSRRRFVAASMCLVGGAASLRRGPTLAASDARALTFFNTHTQEELTAVYFSGGAGNPAVLEQLDRILRDHRSGEIHSMDPLLFDCLYDVAARAGVAPHFDVISGFRSKSSNEMLRANGGRVAEKSMHLRGKAIDVRLRGVETARLRDLALELGRGGVGYYPVSNFVHVDTGRVRTWSGK